MKIESPGMTRFVQSVYTKDQEFWPVDTPAHDGVCPICFFNEFIRPRVWKNSPGSRPLWICDDCAEIQQNMYGKPTNDVLRTLNG